MSQYLSIIVPIFNSALFLETALGSLPLTENMELILVNDGSQDSSFDICNSFASVNSNVKVIDQPNRGYGVACNVGLNCASGDYVAFFEPDDLVGKFFYQRLCDVAHKTQADIVRSNGFYTFNHTVNGFKFAHWDEYDQLILGRDEIKKLWSSHPGICNSIYNRQYLLRNNVCFQTGAGASFQDAQFLVSLYYTVNTIAMVNQSGYYYRSHENQSVNNADSKVEAVIENWQSEFKWLQENGHTNYSYFLFNTFVHFHTLYTAKLGRKESQKRIYAGFRTIAAEVGLKAIAYPEASKLHRLMFQLLAVYPLAWRLNRVKNKVFSYLKKGWKFLKGVWCRLKEIFNAPPIITEQYKNLLFELATSALHPGNDFKISVSSLWTDFFSQLNTVGINIHHYWPLSVLIPHVRIISTHENNCVANLPNMDAFMLWSQFRNNSAIQFLTEAALRSKPVVFMEEGWIRSITPTPMNGYPIDYKIPLSFMADLKTSYFDVTKPSMLEDMLNSDRELTFEETIRAKRLMEQIVNSGLSKLNHQPDVLPDLGDLKTLKILVIDQVCNDWSIIKGAASKKTFQLMLNRAFVENPGADIIIKTHPDMLARSGKANSSGHFTLQQQGGRVKFLIHPVNPYTLMKACQKVYVCSSQMGFESLMLGKETIIFGAPFYAGWGAGDVRNQSPHLMRRKRSRTTLEIFYFMYIEYTRYVQPEQMRPCELEEFISAIIKMKEQFNSIK